MACGGAPLTAGSRAVGLAAAEPIQVCGVAGSRPWLVGLPPAVVRVCGSSFRLCWWVGRWWRASIHAAGEWDNMTFTHLLSCAAAGRSEGPVERVARVLLSCQTECVQCPHLYLLFEDEVIELAQSLTVLITAHAVQLMNSYGLSSPSL